MPAIARASARRLTFAVWAAEGSPHDVLARTFARSVARQTDGGLDIKVVSGGKLGNYSKNLDDTVAGKIDFSLPTSGALARFESRIEVLGLPFLFENEKQAYAAFDSLTMRALLEPMKYRGVVPLGMSTNGVRYVTSNGRALAEADDYVGVRMRVPSVKLSRAIFSALGAVLVELPYDRIVPGLRSGLVVAQENPATLILDDKIFAQQRFLVRTRHQITGIAPVVSARTFAALTPREQDVLREAAAEAIAEHRAAIEFKDRASIAQLARNGIAIVEPNTASLKLKTARVYAEFENPLVASMHEAAALA